MQYIYHMYNNINSIFNDIERAYALTSEYPSDKLLTDKYLKCFKALFDNFKKYGNRDYHIEFCSKQYNKIKPFGKDKMIVCFSGGKDSIATALHYKEAGYTVCLYHMHNINPPLFDEQIQAEKLAEYLDMPIFIEDVILKGRHDYIEHPMKNMIIANGALNYGIREGITTNIAFGNYITSSLKQDNFNFCGGDDIEMWQAYEKIIDKVIPKFKMHMCLQHLGETLEIVCNNKELLELSISCLCRASMRKYWHNWVYNKYNIRLPEHRCGRCYKCCIEYIYMTDHNLQDYNEDYYRYCFNNLRKNVEREDGIKYIDEQVWQHYMFYDISKSKCFSNII